MTAWAVHLPTAGETCLRFQLRPRGDRDPWAFSLALTELQSLGAQQDGRFRAVGSGRGEPIIASQDLRWRGHPLHVEIIRTQEGHEATLTLPSWDELALAPHLTEDDVWQLVDAFAAAVDADRGEITSIAILLRHADPQAPPYRHLPRSGLTVVLR
jgi:hypothetical protein